MKKDILDVVEDLANSLLYYDRQDDEVLPKGSIQKAIKEDIITVDEIIEKFGYVLKEELN